MQQKWLKLKLDMLRIEIARRFWNFWSKKRIPFMKGINSTPDLSCQVRDLMLFI